MADQLSVFRLRFSAPLHIGNSRDDYASGSAMIHSDAMYAAIFQAWAMLGKAEWIPKTADEDFGFTISSLFPYCQMENGQINYFLPRPFYSPDVKRDNPLETRLRKKIKKAVWVDTDLFPQILSGENLTLAEKNFNGAFWSANEMGTEPMISSRVVPRSVVSRFGDEDTKIFYVERFYFTKNAGLYFYINCSDPQILNRVESAMRLLADEGLGTDRNIGHGQFSFEKAAAPNIEVKTEKGMAMAMGLFCPESKAQLTDLLAHQKAGYELVKRGGWLSEPYNTWRKKNIYFFKEGSCFSAASQKHSFLTLGKNVDLRPDQVAVNHPVWRCGKTLFLTF